MSILAMLANIDSMSDVIVSMSANNFFLVLNIVIFNIILIFKVLNKRKNMGFLNPSSALSSKIDRKNENLVDSFLKKILIPDFNKSFINLPPNSPKNEVSVTSTFGKNLGLAGLPRGGKFYKKFDENWSPLIKDKLCQSLDKDGWRLCDFNYDPDGLSGKDIIHFKAISKSQKIV